MFQISLFESRMWSLKFGIIQKHLTTHPHLPSLLHTHTYANSLPVSALSPCGRPGPALSQPASLIAAGAAILPCFIYEPSQQRGERGGERQIEWERDCGIEWVITIFMCVYLFFLFFWLYIFVYSGEVNELWLVTVHIALCLTLLHTHAHTQFYSPQLQVFYSAFALFIKNLQSAADKAVDDSMLDSVFPMLHCACGRVPNMCGAPTSAAALQALKRRNIAYTRCITNSAIAHLTRNKLWMLWPQFLCYYRAVQEFKDQG